MVDNNLEKDLKGIVGDRVTTSEFERWFYTSDILHIPGAGKVVAGKREGDRVS